MKILLVKLLIFFILIASGFACTEKKLPIVFQSDFGLKDGAVSAMKGVCIGVDPDLELFDLTHDIPPYNIWEAAYRLQQTAPYWPEGTVFVSVVDPGVGTDRKSIVLKTNTGHYFVGPDNGSFTLVSSFLGIQEVRQIDEELNRRRNSDESYTFHGRDVYAYTAARLASGTIDFEKVGMLLPAKVILLDYQRPMLNADSLMGNIPILDIQYGNVWTNIPDTLLRKMNIKYGDQILVRILSEDSTVYESAMPFVATFGDVPERNIMAYSNSLMNVSFAINMGNFSDSFNVNSGPEWKVVVKKTKMGN
jgi:S-adenosylmethionine hydrolase